MYVCFATVGTTTEDRYFIISLQDSKGNEATCLPKMFSEKRRNTNGLNSHKEIHNTDTISRLSDTGHPQQTNMHFTQIVLDNSVDWSQRYVDTSLSLWFSCKTSNVVGVGKRKYLYSTVNLIVAKQIYRASELCHRYQRTFIHQFNNFYIAKTWIYSATVAEISVQIWSFFWEI